MCGLGNHRGRFNNTEKGRIMWGNGFKENSVYFWKRFRCGEVRACILVFTEGLVGDRYEGVLEGVRGNHPHCTDGESVNRKGEVICSRRTQDFKIVGGSNSSTGISDCKVDSLPKAVCCSFLGWPKWRWENMKTRATCAKCINGSEQPKGKSGHFPLLFVKSSFTST